MLGPKNCKRKQIYKCQVCSHNLPKALKVGNNWAQILWATDAFVECFRSTSYSFGLCNTQKYFSFGLFQNIFKLKLWSQLLKFFKVIIWRGNWQCLLSH